MKARRSSLMALAFSARPSGRWSAPCWSRGRRSVSPSPPTDCRQGKGLTFLPTRRAPPSGSSPMPGSTSCRWRPRCAFWKTAAPRFRPCWRWNSWPAGRNRRSWKGRGRACTSLLPRTALRRCALPPPRWRSWCGRRAGGIGSWPWCAGTWPITKPPSAASSPPTGCRFLWTRRRGLFPGRWWPWPAPPWRRCKAATKQRLF